MENSKIEVVYTKAKLLKRMGAYFLDLGLTFLTAAIFFAITNTIVTNMNFYKQKQVQLVETRNESRLYEEGVLITTYVDDDTKYPSYKERKIEVSTRLDEFYHNPTYFSDEKIIEEYTQRKLDATTTIEGVSVHLFLKEGEIVIENAVSDETLYNFYKAEVEYTALGYLVKNPTYFYLTRYNFWVTIIEIIIWATIAFVVFYLIFPITCYKRGRQTLGMKMEKIALISVRADNVTTGVYILRFLFMYFVFLILDFVGFLIPAFVSLGMMYFSKTNSSLVNYVFNDYVVDITNQKIYLNALEREESEIQLQEISIENRDLTLK